MEEASEELKTLIKKRASLKSKLTLFEKFLKSVKGLQLSSSETVERSKIIELEQRTQDLESLIINFEDIQGNIECVVDDFKEQLHEREEFSDRYYSVLAKARELLEKLKPVEFDNQSSSSEGQVNSAIRVNNNPPNRLNNGIKLPDIKLPKFDGSFKAWLDFRDIFASLIHTNSNLNEIQKFHYLRASLEGSAIQVIQSLEFSTNNYNIAWNTLCERFNNTNLLIQNHINAIFTMEIITTESATKIRNLSDNLFKHLSSLKQLGEPTDTWDTLIIYICSSKLDKFSSREWERLKAKQQNSCTLEEFKKFLKKRADLLENMEMNCEKNQSEVRPGNNNFRDKQIAARDYKRSYTRNLHINNHNKNENKSKFTCFYCKRDHSLFYCSEFLQLSVYDRAAKARELQLCNNCLRPNHTSKDCTWSGCKICGQKHNSILHKDNGKSKTTLGISKQNEERELLSETSVDKASCNLVNVVKHAILPTAQVQIRDKTGNFITIRALLDCGSQSSFMTSELCQRLKLTKQKVDLTISGISDSTSYASYKCDSVIRSRINTYSFNIHCFILNKITSDIPGFKVDNKCLNIPVHTELADPEFNNSQQIDLLIGSDIFWSILRPEKIKLLDNGPFLQNTKLGWVIAGPLTSCVNNTICNLSKNSIIQQQLAQFWEIEEVSVKRPLSIEEELCEKHFIDHLQLSSEGRYVVSLPLKNSPERLGDSRQIAIKRFASLERKLMSNETLRHLYTSFLREYEQLGHMTEVTHNNDIYDKGPEYVMPHHGVLRETSSTTKLRVVFNASSPSSSGLSLNSLQMNGPIIQSDLLSIILRFRMRAIVLSGDIKMMYRQVLINPEERKLQRIVWRSDPNEPIKTYELNTVTYGTTAGSFLAIRSLFEVANENESKYPKIANIIKRDMYVDDLLTGVDSPEEAQYVIKTLREVLMKRGFDMRKWKSNKPEIIRNFSADHAEKTVEFLINKELDSKILGLLWVSDTDILTYNISSQDILNPKKITKRVILSRIATIFDPLGLISPVIIMAKVLLQKLWKKNLSWDQSLPNDILNTWIEFSSELNLLNDVRAIRKVVCNQPTYLSLHGFSDASESSYGACVYVVSKNDKGERESHLLCAKSKVSPLKSLTMPRLELCAALILANLMAKVLESIDDGFDEIYCWSDSTIVLGWLQTAPNLLKPFVDHRVAEIQRLTKTFKWKHVPTNYNPADLVSRGISPKKIINSKIWWHGPEWLLYDEKVWPKNQIIVRDLPEMRNISLVTEMLPKLYFPFENFSRLLTLKRTAAYMYRFLTNCRRPVELRRQTDLSVEEINKSFTRLIKIAQLEFYSVEISILNSKQELPPSNKILNLKPFIDEQGIMRVGGRLSNSEFSYSKKYPILLSPHHVLTKLIFRHEHEVLSHAGPQLLLASIREQFWPTSGRSIARQTVRSCVKCARYSAQNIQPIMGDLPLARVQPALPFAKVGIDYAGPFLMKDRRGRGCKTIKCWVAVFVCFSTRAIHLELILSLSTDDFLQAFNRFIGRRGKPSEVFSDNGTNFVGANKEIKLLETFLKNDGSKISKTIVNTGIKWHFIPANSPHFGGIWEAGVKSLKYHLKRVLGAYTLFFYDFQTLLVRIESVLNSRPICPLSSCPDDLSPLTPAHFLLGRAGVTIPEGDVSHLQDNRLSQYQLVQKVYQQFWNRWHHEYVSELQQRQKWRRSTGSLKVGQLVVVKDNNLPPMKWRMGRVLELIYGKDGVSRVASVKTADGILTRALVKLCPLPVESSSEDLSRRGACTGRPCNTSQAFADRASVRETRCIGPPTNGSARPRPGEPSAAL